MANFEFLDHKTLLFTYGKKEYHFDRSSIYDVYIAHKRSYFKLQHFLLVLLTMIVIATCYTHLINTHITITAALAYIYLIISSRQNKDTIEHYLVILKQDSKVKIKIEPSHRPVIFKEIAEVKNWLIEN